MWSAPGNPAQEALLTHHIVTAPRNHFGNPQREKYQDNRRIDHWSGIKL
jgi:hypothetical protein